MAKRVIAFTVNSESRTVETYPMRRLLDVLREDLHLTGTKEGCGEGECGACSVILNDRLVNSCLLPIAQADGARVCTIEDLSRAGSLHPMQKAFIECGGAQCGICTPGMIMASVHLLSRCPQPTREQICDALSGNLCRCTGYLRIIESVEKAAQG